MYGCRNDYDGSSSCLTREVGGNARQSIGNLNRLVYPSICSLSGVPVRCGEIVIMIYATVGNIIADAAALHRLCDMKGANGLICCICCLIVWQPEHWARKRPLVDPVGFMVDVSCSFWEKFCVATDKDLWHNADELKRAHGVMGNGGI